MMLQQNRNRIHIKPELEKIIRENEKSMEKAAKELDLCSKICEILKNYRNTTDLVGLKICTIWFKDRI
jgi:hypothetical protein